MAPATTRRASRVSRSVSTRRKTAVSYAEVDTDSDIESSPILEAVDAQVHTPPRPSRSRNGVKSPAARKRHRAPSLLSDDSKNYPKTKRRKSNPSSPKSTEVFESLVPSGIIPKWQTLPYHILVQVFRFAATPIYDERSNQPLPWGKWLLDVAQLCRGFAEPAFTVLYSVPPIFPKLVAHRLVDLLKADPLSMAYKYRQKVESLYIDVMQVAASSLAGNGLLDLYGLIKDLPRLVDLEFYHVYDMSPYRNLDQTIKWTYPETLFEALEYVDPLADPTRGDKTSVCQLRSWSWSSRLAGKRWSLDKISQVHRKPSFASLRKVAFVNYQVPFTKKDDEDPRHENILAAALGNLEKLEHLVFESSTLVNHKLLPMLPKSLRHLELVTCWEIVAEDFATFLLTHGGQLRCLTLNHNQSLNLSFLTVLGRACPKLQVLRMNLTYFNLHATYHDSEPLYEQLLLPTEVPVWPSTMQTIELIQMRKWGTKAAEVFFQSLLDSAGSLPDLRSLSIQAILNIAWRDRASFRDKWVGSLARVFKRVSDPPKKHTTLSPIGGKKPEVVVAIRDRDLVTTSLGGDGSEVTEQSLTKESADLPRRKSLRSSTASYGNRSISNPEDQPETAQLLADLSKSSQSKLRSGEASNASSSFDQETPNFQPGGDSNRRSRRQREKVEYAESDDEAEPPTPSPAPEEKKSGPPLASRELQHLKDTIGFHGVPSFTNPPEASEEGSDVDAEAGDGGEEGREEVIQGMCEIVEVRIDNLRPTETQVTEADFLDEERSGDSDWDGDVDGIDDYAW